MPPDSPRSPPRLLLPDVLRALALWGILVVNLPFQAYPLTLYPKADGLADGVVAWVKPLFVEGKAFMTFAFLFGFGLSRGFAPGAAGRVAYLRRTFTLFALGVAHAVLLYYGDILAAYAVLSLALLPLRDAPPRILAPAFLLGAALSVAAYWRLGTPGGGGGWPPGETERAVAAYGGSFWSGVAQRLRELPRVESVTLLYNLGPSFCAMLAGIAAARAGLLDEPDRLRASLRARAGPLLLAAVPANALYAFSVVYPRHPLAPFGSVALLLGGPALIALYALAVLERLRAPGGGGWLRALAPAGRLSLTNYLGQSLLGAAALYGWGLGLYARLSPSELFGLASAIWAVQVAASAAWVRAFGAGPLERVLRRVVRGRRPLPLSP